MTTTLDRVDLDIDKLLAEHAPEGSRWVIVHTMFDPNATSQTPWGKAHGPFDSFTEAHDWATENLDQDWDVYPLFTPSP